MKRRAPILIVIICLLGLLGLRALSLPKLGEGAGDTDDCGRPLDTTALKSQLLAGTPPDPCLSRQAIRLLNVRTLNNVKGEIKITDIIK